MKFFFPLHPLATTFAETLYANSNTIGERQFETNMADSYQSVVLFHTFRMIHNSYTL